MSNSDSTRKISQDFLDSLKSGELSQLTEMVKREKDLIMCFRDGYINVYYNSHSVFKITEQKKNYKVEFNMGHARYTKDRESRWDELKAEIPNINLSRENTWFYVSRNGKVFNFEKVCEKYIEFIKDFFNQTMNKDYFKSDEGIESTKNKSGLIEKQHQQKLFSNYFSNNSNYVFYDMELSIPNNSSYGSPDCLALRMENGEPKAIVLVEVKSTENACIGSHGICKHKKDFEYIKKNKSDWIKKATTDIFEQYKYLDMINVDKVSEITDIEILFVFTSKETESWINKTNQRNANYKEYLKLTDSEKMFVNYD